MGYFLMYVNLLILNKSLLVYILFILVFIYSQSGEHQSNWKGIRTTDVVIYIIELDCLPKEMLKEVTINESIACSCTIGIVITSLDINCFFANVLKVLNFAMLSRTVTINEI